MRIKHEAFLSHAEQLMLQKEEFEAKISHAEATIRGLRAAVEKMRDEMINIEIELTEELHAEEWGYIEAQMAKDD